MKNFSSIVLKVVVFCLLFNVSLFIAWISKPISLRDKAQEGKPFCFKDDRIYMSAITDLAVCGNHLYVLYDTKMVMACYELNGDYLCSYSFDMIDKGIAHLHTTGDKLYLESRDHSLYAFSNAQFIGYYPQKFDTIQIEKQFFSDSLKTHTTGGGTYEIRGASIWNISYDKAIEVVHRPAFLALFQGNILLFVHIVCIILIFLIRMISIKHNKI